MRLYDLYCYVEVRSDDFIWNAEYETLFGINNTIIDWNTHTGVLENNKYHQDTLFNHVWHIHMNITVLDNKFFQFREQVIFSFFPQKFGETKMSLSLVF